MLQIATEESTSSASYTLLGTEDKIPSVAIPGGAVLAVTYAASWKESVLGAGRAAIFLGTNQLKRRNGSVQETRSYEFTKYTDTSNVTVSATINEYHDLVTFGEGLTSTTSVPVAVGTGQVLAANAFNTFPQASSETPPLTGLCLIDADAGIYDVSVKFKASSGTVTAKDRKLRAWLAAT